MQRHSQLAIRALDSPDAEAYRHLRLLALSTSPEAFGSSHEEEAALPLERFAERARSTERSVIFGGFAGNALVGMAGFIASEQLKTRHKGHLWGVFLRSEWRGRGLGDALVARVIEHAAKHVLILQAGVVTANRRARETYRRLGFVPYGTETAALCINGIFYDEELLALDLRAHSRLSESPPGDAGP